MSCYKKYKYDKGTGTILAPGGNLIPDKLTATEELNNLLQVIHELRCAIDAIDDTVDTPKSKHTLAVRVAALEARQRRTLTNLQNQRDYYGTAVADSRSINNTVYVALAAVCQSLEAVFEKGDSPCYPDDADPLGISPYR